MSRFRGNGSGSEHTGQEPAAGRRKDLPQELRLTRRVLMTYLLASAGAGTAAAQGVTPELSQGLAKGIDAAKIDPNLTINRNIVTADGFPESWTYSNPNGELSEFSLFRARDLLNLNVRLVNMVVSGSGAERKIKRIDAGKPALLIVRFPPQAIAETTWLDPTGTPSIAPPAKGETAKSRLSGRSRISFKAPDGFTDMPFTVDEVLSACRTWPLNLDPRAIVPPATFFPQGHGFDRTGERLTKAVSAQKAALHGDDAAVEPLLKRAADRVTDAIAEALAAGRVLSDADIDALISDEIAQSLASKASPTPMMLKKSGAKATISPQTVVSAQVNQNLFAMATGYSASGAIVPSSLAEAMKTRNKIASDATDIEVPFRLHMTPSDSAGFAHRTQPVDHGAYAELWHTRMGTRIGDWVLGDHPEPLRALWTDDWSKSADDIDADTDTFHPYPLTGSDRSEIVSLMTGVAPIRLPGYIAMPAVAKHLRLTALGASMDVLGEWDSTKSGRNISLWHHISSIARDQYVRVVYEGYLFPFGHRAAYVKVSERKFSGQTGGGRVAPLLQRNFIIVRQRVRDFPGTGQRYAGRDMPFSTVEITTRQTPDLALPAKIAELGADFYFDPNTPDKPGPAYLGFWPSLSGGKFPFHLIGIDAAGRRTAFEMPLVFVAGDRQAGPLGKPDALDLGGTGMRVERLINYYNGAANAQDLNKTILDKALVRFSQPVTGAGAPLPEDEGEHDYHATDMRFNAWKAVADPGAGEAKFFPGVASASIEVPAVRALTGAQVEPSVKYDKVFLENGFGAANPADLVFRFAKQAVPGVTTDRFGGMVQPGLVPEGLSRKFGAVNKAAAFLAKNVQPIDLFPTSDATLLGFLPLGSILNEMSTIATEAIASKPPRVQTVTTGDKVVTTYDLVQPKLKPLEPLFYPHDPDPGQPQLRVTTTLTVDKTGADPETRVSATLQAFTINMFGFITLNFDRLDMLVQPGSKTDVNPVLTPGTGVMFGGPLEFLNSLRDIIPMSGFSDPPALDVSPSGVSASYSLTLPNVGVGALTLQNLSLGAGFDLPFTGDRPSARFNFAERHNPFNLTVSLFGGGGFFAIALDTSGVRELEAAIEFGAQVSIDLGVASGGVYVKAGFYFHWTDDMVAFAGYVEVGGHLSVLGLVTVSLTFHLELTYEKVKAVGGAPHGYARLYGTATLTVEIDILFFSCSQDVTVEKQFSGSDADPKFIEFCPGDVTANTSAAWADYCQAFA